MDALHVGARVADGDVERRLGKNTPEYADMVTSMCDLRAALNIALGVPVEHITGEGYPDLEYIREQRLGTKGVSSAP